MSTTIIVAIILTSVLFIALLGLIVSMSRHKKKSSGALHLIGSVARVETELRPEGAVIVGGELWRARLINESGTLKPGSRARVIGANGHLLEVEKAVTSDEMVNGK